MEYKKEFWLAALSRALRTLCQVFVSMIAVGSTISDVDWLNILSVAAVSAMLSIFTSVATGLPEADTSKQKGAHEE